MKYYKLHITKVTKDKGNGDLCCSMQVEKLMRASKKAKEESLENPLDAAITLCNHVLSDDSKSSIHYIKSSFVEDPNELTALIEDQYKLCLQALTAKAKEVVDAK